MWSGKASCEGDLSLERRRGRDDIGRLVLPFSPHPPEGPG